MQGEFDYDRFYRRVLGGAMLWPSIAVAVVSACMLVELASSAQSRVRAGTGFVIFTAFSLVLWTGLAIVNWRNARNSRRR